MTLRLKTLIWTLLINAALLSQTVVNYTSSDENFANPERGFYTPIEGWNEYGSLTASQLTSVKNEKQSLILRQYYIPKWTGSDLSSAFLTMFENDMKVLRQNGIKCVLRIAYSNNIGVADAPLNIVQRHLDQLAPYFAKYYDVIAFMQAGFIGAWGEWHSSTSGLDNTANRKAVLEKILSVLPKERMVQIRTPNYKCAIFNNYSPIQPANAFDQSNFSRTGHHNDCFLADNSDMGTYSDTTFERAYLAKDALYVPIGGETCGVSDFSGCPNTVYQMNRLHWTYVNSDYHASVLNGWTSNGCMPEIQRRLGYRFELMTGTYSDSAKQGSAISAALKLRNVGFASLYNLRDVEVILRSTTDTFFVKLPVDARTWKSGDTTDVVFDLGLPLTMPSGDYSLSLNLPDPSPNLHYASAFSIRCANTGVWEAATGYNNLNAKVNINQNNKGTVYTGNLYFAKLDKTTDIKTDNASTYEMSISNYPNPFNNSTEIIYSVKNPGNIKIKIYNSVGQEVETLVNEFREPGTYKVNFNTASACTQLASGIYFYVLNSTNRAVSGKMVLMK